MTQSTSSRNAAKEPVIKNLLPYHAESAKETKNRNANSQHDTDTDEYDDSDDYLIILRRNLMVFSVVR